MHEPVFVISKDWGARPGDGATGSAQHKAGGRELLRCGALQYAINIKPRLGSDVLMRYYDVVPGAVARRDAGADYLSAGGDISEATRLEFECRVV